MTPNLCRTRRVMVPVVNIIYSVNKTTITRTLYTYLVFLVINKNKKNKRLWKHVFSTVRIYCVGKTNTTREKWLQPFWFITLNRSSEWFFGDTRYNSGLVKIPTWSRRRWSCLVGKVVTISTVLVLAENRWIGTYDTSRQWRS